MTEKLVEKKLREAVKKLGGLALKFWPISAIGFPDRMVLMPGGKIYFVELKSTGEEVKKHQMKFILRLRFLGFFATVVDDEKTLSLFLEHIQ